MSNQIKVPAKKEELPKVQSFIDQLLEEHNFSQKTMMQIDMAVEELFVNIVLYAYSEQNDATVEKMVTVDCHMISDDMIEIKLTDSGDAFDPVAKSNPDVTLAAEERNIGGLGIFMVKQSMDVFAYERKNEQNIVKICKKK